MTTRITVRIIIAIAVTVTLLFHQCGTPAEEIRTFYRTNLVCTVDKTIGCGSKVKPLFLEIESIHEIKECWLNRQGTVIAVVWQENVPQDKKNNIIQPLLEKHGIKADHVTDAEMKARLSESFFSNVAPAQKGKDKWYKGREIDQLSFEEARIMSDTATAFALKAGLINEEERNKVKKEIEDYMRTELVKPRTLKDLSSDETDLKWKKYGYEIYVKHIGTERAEKVRDHYVDYQKLLIHNKTGTSQKPENELSSLPKQIKN